ncbi:sensor domain-containing diguanylate cyclase [Aliiglaciecola sp. 3_MG-2023]|uniref:sensor domain-containing diguanylate cyclase n=1 Tax=Aliiglaciecola sp. 3_MG-2023 TaxID=3062644 RepID=UPI0026E302D7|nr:sensor domain-containing diguanylate cyclase [Aliiglaciecola sp. 3_MG-2023]MDO6692316.1 sensor domain-containing diguanylate cyclase [Aliiglaciecola sp. 3_MG-2023]
MNRIDFPMTVKMKERSLEDIILLAITGSATLILFPFFILSLQSDDEAHILVDLVAVSGIFIIFLGVWFTSKIKLFSGLFAIVAQVTIILGIHFKGVGLIYWVFPIIIASFYLLPTLVACLFNLLLISIICLLTYEQFDSFTLPRIIAAFIVTNAFSLIFSVFMQNKNRQLLAKDKINQLNNTILELIVKSNNLSKVLPAITQGIENEIPEAMCGILLIDEKGKTLILGAGPKLPAFYNDGIDGSPIGLGMGPCSEAAYTGKRVMVSDVSSQANKWAKLAIKAGLASCWSEPIIGNQGNLLGTLCIYYRKATSLKNSDFKLIEQFVNLARIAIERQKTDQIIWQQAHYDSLTNLPNRNLLHEHLASSIANAKRDNKQLAIAMLDLDNFKNVNDTLGHEAGDTVLIECAKRITSCIRNNDIAARLGGDEFIVVFIGTSLPKDVEQVAKKLSETLAQPYQLKGQEVFCTASIGIALFPKDAQSVDALFRNADQAMYTAKTQGRNAIHYFNTDMEAVKN